jgi:NADPH:quinone reductase-like Zn-dependent oxidoreductase
VCSTGKIDLVKSLGADHVIDYTREDFKQSGQTWDVIVDTVPGANTFEGVKSSLTEKGIYAPVAGGIDTLWQGMWTSMQAGKRIAAGPAFPTREDLEFLVKLTQEGKIRAVIDRRFPLEQTAAAHAYVDTGHKTGSVIITVP